MEHRLGLTTITGLLAVVTTLTLGEQGGLYSMSDCFDSRNRKSSTYLSSLVLGDLVLGVLLAVLALAVGAASLWYVHL